MCCRGRPTKSAENRRSPVVIQALPKVVQDDIPAARRSIVEELQAARRFRNRPADALAADLALAFRLTDPGLVYKLV